MGDEGLELPPQTPGKTALSQTGGTESGTLGAQMAPEDADLRMVVDAWTRLPEAVKTGILAMVRQYGPGDGREE